ncbi:MAG: bifunctional (p)ppGpp synthetase/guanosine-3',5'-bis(diphosphate) 3'-pyrophosphohydrolase [bacterium]|nr:bifunctional (p)ppGpp synthetase/guanosine-3',5'-bis(diphosphate) 3'-pyrophosphohydrolase [bacterium]
MIKRFFELQEKVQSYHNNANTKLLKKAYSVAAAAHSNQKRASKEDYILHPLAVAAILADMKLDEISIAAGLLHDVVEDSDYTVDDITKLFGNEISSLVEGVTKITKISAINAEDAKAETLKKMIIAMTHDIRVILIKLADRYHNIMTLEALRPDKRERIAKETLDIYAPIAYRLGMGKMKTDLEDVSFKYAYPSDYGKIEQRIADKKKWANDKMKHLKQELQKILDHFNMKGQIHYRMKREISIHRKLERQSITFENVFDLLALRIVTNSIENCYAILGEIHQRWQFIPFRLRDFIANQKANGYQSIHTTIITTEGIKFEIQIRTKEMHKMAEEGIAAHWKYKEGIKFIEGDRRLQWFRDMIDTHKESPNPTDFLNLVKGDLTPNEIYVFTPKGKVVNLKAGATAIDFAYAIHTEVGDHCKGAVVNEHMAPIRTPLNSGEVVEIITNSSAHPSLDWLKHVATSKARKKIMTYIQKREHAGYHDKGKKLWNRVLKEYRKRYKLNFKDAEINQRIRKVMHTDLDAFLRAIGANEKLLDKQMLRRLFPEASALDIKVRKRVRKKNLERVYQLVNVDGLQGIEVSFAKCCSPIKGEKISGYMTQNRGLMIHQEDCTNLRKVMESRQKNVKWNTDTDYAYQVKFVLLVQDKPGILNAVTAVNTKYNSNIHNITTERVSQHITKIKLAFEVKDINQLEKISRDFHLIKGAISVNRKRVA